jgi:multisubunit Na+/H+ antiporter MnhG subunit
MTRSSWLWPLIITVSALAAGYLALVDSKSPLRPLVAFWFLLVCPGLAYVGLLRLKDFFAEWALSVALSLAIDGIVVGILSYARAWSANLALLIIIGVTLIGVYFQLLLALEASLEGATNRFFPRSLRSLMISIENRLTTGRLVGFVVGSLAFLALLFLIWFRS